MSKINFNLLNNIELRELLLLNLIKPQSSNREYLIESLNKLLKAKNGNIKWIDSLKNKSLQIKYINPFSDKSTDGFAVPQYTLNTPEYKYMLSQCDKVSTFKYKIVTFSKGYTFYRLSKNIREVIDLLNKDEIWVFHEIPKFNLIANYCENIGNNMYNNCRMFELQLKKDIKLLDMSDKNTVLKLFCDEKVNIKLKKLINYAFAVDDIGVIRTSIRDFDHNFSYELCKLGYDGMIFLSNKHLEDARHHDEVNICNPSNLLEYIEDSYVINYIYPIPIEYPVTKCISIDYVNDKRHFIKQLISIYSDNYPDDNLNNSPKIEISTFGLYYMFDLYNKYFFNGCLPEVIITKSRDNNYQKPIIIRKVYNSAQYDIIYSNKFFNHELDGEKVYDFGGILCSGKISCTQLLFESALINLAIYDKSDKNINAKLFIELHKTLFKAYFDRDIQYFSKYFEEY
jgi:hypothetical protein